MIRALLFDRDGTLIEDVGYLSDPDGVVIRPGAREALDLARAARVAVGIVTNQSGVARGIMTVADVRRVNARVVELLGPFGAVAVCPHGPGDGCACRKPRSGLVLDAADLLGVRPEACAVLGDRLRDVDAGRGAGARGVLVPSSATPRDEIARAELVVHSLVSAVRVLVAHTRNGPGGVATAGAGAGDRRTSTGRPAVSDGSCP